MNNLLLHFQTKILEPLGLSISRFTTEKEGQEYAAAKLEVAGKTIIYRHAKITPKKVGQFVACWKRTPEGITAPYHEKDELDFYWIWVEKENQVGVFIFSKAVLEQNGILSTLQKEGKRGFRVYPIWDNPTSKQAIKTQQWQLEYFYEIDGKLELNEFTKLLHQE